MRPSGKLATALLLLVAFLAMGMFPTALFAQQTVVEYTCFDMSSLLDDASSPWERIGSSWALLLADRTLLINDNSRDENIAFQSLLGEVQPEHHVSLSARVQVVSNSDGSSAIMEISRPGLEIVLELFPEGIRLMERQASGYLRWMGESTLDLMEFHEILLEKAASTDDPRETVTVTVDGAPLITAVPQGEGHLNMGRLVVGSLSYQGVGASVWEWLEVEVREGSSSNTPTDVISFGALKAAY